jgi:hypothetical protein
MMSLSGSLFHMTGSSTNGRQNNKYSYIVVCHFFVISYDQHWTTYRTTIVHALLSITQVRHWDTTQNKTLCNHYLNKTLLRLSKLTHTSLWWDAYTVYASERQIFLVPALFAVKRVKRVCWQVQWLIHKHVNVAQQCAHKIIFIVWIIYIVCIYLSYVYILHKHTYNE